MIYAHRQMKIMQPRTPNPKIAKRRITTASSELLNLSFGSRSSITSTSVSRVPGFIALSGRKEEAVSKPDDAAFRTVAFGVEPSECDSKKADSTN